MAATQAYLNARGLTRFPLLANTTLSWSTSSGVSPDSVTVFLSNSDVKKLVNRIKKSVPSTGFSLEFKSDGKSINIRELLLLKETPNDSPLFGAVVLTDRRWLWHRRHILRRYNIRRRSRMVRRMGPDGAPVQITQLNYPTMLRPTHKETIEWIFGI